MVYIEALINVAALLWLFSLLNRYRVSPVTWNVAVGIMFGLSAVYGMLQPIQIASGIQVDARSLFISFAGAIGGVIGATIALVLAGTTRILIGGVGLGPGLIAMVFCACVGVIWYALNKRKILPKEIRWLVLWAMISLSIPILLLLPDGIGLLVFTNNGPYLLLIYLIGTIVLGITLEGEKRFGIMQHELTDSAEKDPLTGALNRRGFVNKFSTKTKSKKNISCFIMVLDVNNFKEINDRFGHDVGDLALIQIVRLIESNTRDSDLISRLGGDEFSVCLFELDINKAEEIAQKLEHVLRFKIDLPTMMSSEQCYVSFSVGYQFFNGLDPDLGELLRMADAKMMLKKRNSRGVAKARRKQAS